MSIYQYNTKLEMVAEYASTKEAERITGIFEGTISSAALRGSLCQKQWYFSRNRKFVPPARIKGEERGKKFTVVVTNGMWDRLLVAIGQRKKQDIFRNLLSEWLENEERKLNGQDNKAS